MRDIVISIQPKWVDLILSGEKTIEVRKVIPNQGNPYKCYIYQTKKPVSVSFSGWGRHISEYDKTYYYNNRSGRVVGEFICNDIDTYLLHGNIDSTFVYRKHKYPHYYKWLVGEGQDIDYGKLCLNGQKMENYGKGKPLYGLHISDLKIYDKPKDLSEFGLKRAPQSWCYVEEK